MTQIKALPTKGKKNDVEGTLKKCIETDYDEVFVIGLKDGYTHTIYSGYEDIVMKLGLLELLKQNLVSGAK